MARITEERSRRSRSAQVILLMVSIFFCLFIAYGWINLFLRFGPWVAIVAGFLAALLAWVLAREVGENRSRRVLLIPLFMVSAAGVYNSLMLYADGGPILIDAANTAEGQFAAAQSAAENGLATSGAAAHLNRVNSLTDALVSEIRNPLNCGQGPKARQLIGELQRELPGFTALSDAGKNCAHIEEVVNDYKERIAGLVARAAWNDPALVQAAADAAQSRQAVDAIRGEVSASYTPTMVAHVVSELGAQDAKYRDLRYRLSRRVDVKELRPDLDLEAAQSLGDVFKIVPLFIARLNQVTTWVFLVVAIGLDLFMVYVFGMNAASRVERRAPGHALSRGM